VPSRLPPSNPGLPESTSLYPFLPGQTQHSKQPSPEDKLAYREGSAGTTSSTDEGYVSALSGQTSETSEDRSVREGSKETTSSEGPGMPGAFGGNRHQAHQK